MIKKEQKRIWIKGVTLYSFFDTDNDLYRALYGACAKGIDVRILVLDPECEEAQLRGFREYLICHPNEKYEDFLKVRQKERLYLHTTLTIGTIQRLLRQLGNPKPTNSKPTTEAKKYSCGPEAFMLLTDESVLVEQYHLGSFNQKETLGGEVPLIEYQRVDKPDPLNYPYGLFENHFNFVWEQRAVSLTSQLDVPLKRPA